MNLLIALKKSWNAVRKKPFLFTLLVLLQLTLLVSIGFVALSYQLKIFDDVTTISTTLEKANLDADKIQEGEPFLRDIAPIYTSYKNIIKNVYWVIGLISVLFLLLNGAIWVLSHRLVNAKNMLQQWYKFAVSSIIFFLPFFVASVLFIRSYVAAEGSLDTFVGIIKGIGIVFLVFYYLALVAFGILHTKDWKQFAQRWYKLALKKLPLTALVLTINVLLIWGSGYLLSLTLNNEEKFGLIVLATILFLLTIAFSRIFWIVSLKEIDSSKSFKI